MIVSLVSLLMASMILKLMENSFSLENTDNQTVIEEIKNWLKNE